MLIANKQQACLDYTGSTKGGRHPETDIGPLMEVSQIRRNVATGIADKIVVKINDHHYSQFEFILDTSELYSKEPLLRRLNEYHVTMDPKWEPLVKAYLVDEYNKAKYANKISFEYDTLGWHTFNGRNYYLCGYRSIGGHNYYYSNDALVFRRGSETEYTDFLNRIVYPNPRLSLAMAIGYSSVVNARLNLNSLRETIVVNFCGASSTGKTTAEELLISAFGNPEKTSQDGFMHSFNSTQTARFSVMECKNGVPMVFDDTTTNAYVDTANLVYTWATNDGKARCDGNGSLQKRNSKWSGTIIVSSETPIQDSGRQNKGVHTRVLHTDGIVWTPNAETAEAIKSFVKTHYGHTGPKFAQYIELLDDEYLESMLIKSREVVNGIMQKKDDLTERLASKYAIIHMTIELMNSCFNIRLDSLDLMNILIAPEQATIESRDIANKAYNVLVDFISTKYRTHFDVHRFQVDLDGVYHDFLYDHCKGDNYGLLSTKNGITSVYMQRSTLESLLKNHQINEFTSIYRKWVSEDKLVEGDTYHYAKKTPKEFKDYTDQTRCMCIQIPTKEIVFPDSNDSDQAEAVFNTFIQTHSKRRQNQIPTIEDDFDDTEAINEIFANEGDKQ